MGDWEFLYLGLRNIVVVSLHYYHSRTMELEIESISILGFACLAHGTGILFFESTIIKFGGNTCSLLWSAHASK